MHQITGRGWIRAAFAACGIALASLPLAAPAQENWQDRLEEARKDKSLREQARTKEAQWYFDRGMTAYERQQYKTARDAFQKAEELGHPQGQEMLTKANGWLEVPPDKYQLYLKQLSDERVVEIQARRQEIQNALSHGDRLRRQGLFEEAIETYQGAQDLIRFMPAEVPGKQEWMAQAKSSVEQARAEQVEARRTRNEQMRETMQAIARADEEKQVEFLRNRIRNLMEQAREAESREEYVKAIGLAEQVLAQDPHHRQAKDLLARSKRLRHLSAEDRIAADKRDHLRRLEEFSDEMQVPYDPNQPLHFPDNWSEIRATRTVPSLSEVHEEPWKAAIRAKLEERMEFRFPGTPFEQARDFLQRQTNVTILLDPTLDTQTLRETPINLTATGQRLKTVLDLLVRFLGEEYAYTLKNEAIWISTKEGVQEEAMLRHYDTRDLTIQIRDFIGPEISLSTPEDEGGGLILETEAETAEAITGDDLKDLLERQIGSEVFQQGNNSIEFHNGQIIVNAPPDVHKKVEDLLSGFRGQRQLQVTIQSRFITVDNDLLDDIAVMTQGLPSRPVSVPGGGAPTNASAGILNPSGGSSQLGIRNPGAGNPSLTPLLAANLFGANPTTAGAANTAAASAGTIFQYTYLKNWQVQMILRAVHMTRKGTLINAPMITCFNTQRANMSVINQLAYIRDFTIITNQAAVGADPEIGFVQSGVVFDVRPIVSADRKFITLEMRPSVAQFNGFRIIPSQLAAGVNVQIEAPQITLRSIRTTVSMPDNGTLMIGGLSNIQETHQYSGIPGLSKIPILSFLFGRDADVSEKNNLLILTRAKIVDLEEEEQRLFGRQ